MPGYDRSRIVGLTDKELDEFTCGICLGVFFTPVVTQCCRQTYCKDCIREWVSLHKTCPNDRKTLTKKGLKPVPRVLINLLENNKIKCDFEVDGCTQVVTIGELSQHLTVCEFRPNQLCKTCGLIRESISTHNCIEALVSEKQKSDEKYLNLLDENSTLLLIRRENDETITELRRELGQLRINHQKAVEQLKNEQKKANTDLNMQLSAYERRLSFNQNILRSEMEKNKNLVETITGLKNDLAQSKINYQRGVDKLISENSKELQNIKQRYDRINISLRGQENSNSILRSKLFESGNKLSEQLEKNEKLMDDLNSGPSYLTMITITIKTLSIFFISLIIIGLISGIISRIFRH